jgi:hypothetical protein
VRLDSNEKEISVSSYVLRRMDFDRLTVITKVSALTHTSYIDDVEAIATTDDQLLSQLIGEVSDVVMDEARFSSLYELKASGQKFGSCSNKKNKKLRKRAKFSQSQNIFLMNDMFSNSKSLGDLAKHLFLPFRKPIDENLHKVFLIDFQVALTLCGILVCLVDVLVASY